MNTICHVEIPVLDLEKASKFFSKIFEWNVDTEALPNYGLANREGVSIGMPLVQSIDYANTRTYVQVDDINETLEKVKQAGGKVVSEKNLISDQIGFGAKFEDIFGNQIGLFAPK